MSQVEAPSRAPRVSSPLPVHARADAVITEGAPALQVRDRGVTLRVVILCLALATLFGYALPVIDYKLNNTFMGAQHLPPGAVGVLLLLVLVVNPLLRLASRSGKRQWALSRNEALTVYISCLFSSLVPGHGSENFVIPNLLASFYYATRENKWLEFLQPYLKPWLTPALHPDGTLNTPVYTQWYTGLDRGGSVPWGAWLVPLAFWIGFVLVSYVMLGCLSVILRAQWAEREALAFPLLRLPLEMTQDLDRTTPRRFKSGFFRNTTMWSGFALAVFIQVVSGLHVYYPDVPDIVLGLDMGPYLAEPPWNQIGWVPVTIFPVVIGITYLLTSEISFSLWFFYWFMKFELIAAYFLGYPSGTLPGAPGLPDKVFTGYQQMGCYACYVSFVLWTGRAHLRHVAQRALGRVRADKEEASEVISYPIAFWGFVGSFILMVGATVAAGVRVDIALVLWISYLVLAIGLTRVAVEGGMLALQHGSVVLEPISRLINSGHTQWLTLENGVVPASLFQAGIVNHMRGFTMPSFVHSLKLAHDHRIASRPLVALVVATVLISVAVSWHTCVRLGYETSGLSLGHTWYARDGSRNPAYFINNMLNFDGGDAPTGWLWLSVGALLTYIMMVGRARLLFFPFHPIGYIMAMTYPTYTFWFSIFLGWLLKSLITRFGGNDSYRRATPFFLGLALGDVAMILFWLLIDGWQGRSHHLLLPG